MFFKNIAMKNIYFLFLLFTTVSFAQDGSLDTSFGENGIVITDIDNNFDWGMSIVEQSDQKILVSGVTSINQDDYSPLLIRYLPNGEIDTSFGDNGKVTADFGIGVNFFDFLFIDDSSNIFAAGNFGIHPNLIFTVVKYNENGSIDSTFANNGVLELGNEDISNMILLNDGSLLFVQHTTSNEITLIHYFPDGTLDTSFGENGYATSAFSAGGIFQISQMKFDPSGNIYCIGARNSPDNSYVILMKFNPTGYLDTSFGNEGVSLINFDNLDLYPFTSASFDFANEDKIVVAGSYGICHEIGEGEFYTFFIRYLSDGTLDSTFGNEGILLNSISSFLMKHFIIQGNKRLLIAGEILDCFEGGYFHLYRLYSNGSNDPSFNEFTEDFSSSKMIIQDDGKIVTVGSTWWYNGDEDILITRHNNNPLNISDFKPQKLVVTPNPNSGQFTVQKARFSYENLEYQIVDISGKIIKKGVLENDEDTIDISFAEKGIYFLKIQNQTFKLIKK
jgi:uncharacterized delta-60 repeat protein